jgi:hypothetical protein
MNLKNHFGPFHDEAAYNVHYGLEDYWYARHLLRRVGEEERSRFSELGWAYGDPSYGYGTDPFEVFRFQANVVAKTLFGYGVACDLHCFASDDEALWEFLADLRDEDGLAAFADDEYPEGPGYGDSSLLAAEITGEGEAIWRLKGALRSRGARPVYYDPASERGRGYERGTHLLLLYDAEIYPERETIHHELFGLLIRAKEAMDGDHGR